MAVFRPMDESEATFAEHMASLIEFQVSQRAVWENKEAGVTLTRCDTPIFLDPMDSWWRILL